MAHNSAVHKLFAVVVVASCLLRPASPFKPCMGNTGNHHDRTAALLQVSQGRRVNASAKVIRRQADLQPPNLASLRSSLERRRPAFSAVILGIILIMFSLPSLWLNEKRNAKYEALIGLGERDCQEMCADDYDEKNAGCLIHVTGRTFSAMPVADKQFNINFETGVIRLSSNVEIYQYSEVLKAVTVEKERLGGGTETITRKIPEYQASWKSYFNSGKQFHDQAYQNKKPEGIVAGTSSSICKRVELGKGYLLQDGEISQLCGESTFTLKSQLVCAGNPSLQFTEGADGYYYHPQTSATEPSIGDVRVAFTILEDALVSVLGLQCKLEEPGRGGFLPYRVIPRPLCPWRPLPEDQKKELLLVEARKSRDELIAEEIWGGMMWCLCWPCNIAHVCCVGGMLPELHHVFGFGMTKTDSFRRIRQNGATAKWLLRLVGWATMFAGLFMTFSPFTTLLRIIPFGVGPLLSSEWLVVLSTFSFLLTLIVNMIIIAISHGRYNPLFGTLVLTAMTLLILGMLTVVNLLPTKLSGTAPAKLTAATP